MTKFNEQYNFAGMQRDLAVSKHPAQYLYDAHNVRLTSREGDTLLTITNEQGTKYIELPTLCGHYIGHCTLNNYLVLFCTGKFNITSTTTTKEDFIFRINLAQLTNSETKDKVTILYHGSTDENSKYDILNFDQKYPIKAIGSYESALIQKVYWTDGYNPLRMINISEAMDSKISNYNSLSFNFIPELELREQVKVKKLTGATGTFAPGKIQYAFTYFYKYGQESGIFYTTPLFDISHRDRGASPEDKVNNAFQISISNLDSKNMFDYIRIYSIQRTSLDATPITKVVQDISLEGYQRVDETEIDNLEYYESESRVFTFKNGNRILSFSENSDSASARDFSFNSYLLADDDSSTYGFNEDNGTMERFKTADDVNGGSGASSGTGSSSGSSSENTGDSSGDTGSTGSSNNEDTKPNLIIPVDNTLTLTTKDNDVLSFFVSHTVESWKNEYMDVVWTGYPVKFFPNLEIYTSNGIITFTDDAIKENNNTIIWVSQWSKNNVFDRQYIVCTVGGRPIESTVDGVTKITWDFKSESSNVKNGNIKQTEDDHYQMQRTKTNQASTIVFTDTGTTGFTIDPTELIYKWSEDVRAVTMTQKDGTLFLGNLQLYRNSLQNVKVGNKTLTDTIKNTKSNIECNTRKFYPTVISSGTFHYANQLTSYDKQGYSVPCVGFKCGDYYRLGVQFQHKSGKWSDPIYISDEKQELRSFEDSETYAINIPCFTNTLTADIVNKVMSLDYRKARAVVVLPSVHDRQVICQGVINPTMYTRRQREYNKSLYAQSSWFFRPKSSNSVEKYLDSKTGAVLPSYTEGKQLEYTSIALGYIPKSDIRRVEIQGNFLTLADTVTDSRFTIDNSMITMHSPDIEFDTQLSNLEFDGVGYAQVGVVKFVGTMSDIEIQTETPTISNQGSGFIHRAFTTDDAKGIVAGLFYDDFIVDDSASKDFEKWSDEKAAVKWLVYPWQGQGSLNNDCNRPSDKGSPTAILKKKIISNLRFTSTDYYNNINTPKEIFPQLFNNQEVALLKFGIKNNDNIKFGFYEGNVDTVLTPELSDGMYFVKAGELKDSAITPFISESEIWYKTLSLDEGTPLNPGIYHYNEEEKEWKRQDRDQGDKYIDLVLRKALVRMKYKSTPHIVFQRVSSDNLSYSGSNDSETGHRLPIVEIVINNKTDNLFGGTTEQALRENIWIPCGEAVLLQENTECNYEYSWGDTYFQRYDCLKTYAFTQEDINQIVEIGSFMLETHVNIDGRYDRNRLQQNNLYMSPINYNLINPVYSQTNNFFQYKILDSESYKNNTFPTQITWTKEKQFGADIDLWTHITLASTYDLDGSKGFISSLNTWGNTIFCFQRKGISNILFNSRVQVQTTDGVPIEITNNYKVEGHRYIVDGVGCKNQQLVKETPSGIYFVDSINNYLQQVTDKLLDLNTTHNMSTVANKEMNTVTKLLYDDVHKDIYMVNNEQALCYSEILGQFTSFMDYGGIPLIESYGNRVFTASDINKLNGITLFQMFAGEYNNFFGYNWDYYESLDSEAQTIYVNNYKPWSITFTGNGSSNNTYGFDKTFTNLEFRATIDTDGTLGIRDKFTPITPFDSIEVWNEYQHGYSTLKNLTGHQSMVHHKDNDSALKRKFRIWRCDIPRNNCLLDKVDTNSDSRKENETYPYSKDSELGISRHIRKSNDRMRNPWLYFKLQKNTDTNKRTEIHDIMTTYFV